MLIVYSKGTGGEMMVVVDENYRNTLPVMPLRNIDLVRQQLQHIRKLSCVSKFTLVLH